MPLVSHATRCSPWSTSQHVDEARLIRQRELYALSSDHRRPLVWREYKHAVTASDFRILCVRAVGQERIVCMYTLCRLALYECLRRWLTDVAAWFMHVHAICMHECLHDCFGRSSSLLQEESCMMDALREQALGTVLLASIYIRTCRASKCRGAKIR